MAFSNIDRTQEVEKRLGVVQIKSTDHCRFYEKHPDTFLQRKECWTCIYGEFGISTGNPSDTGNCEYTRQKRSKAMSPEKRR